MQTEHVNDVSLAETFDRPVVPVMNEGMLVKAKFKEGTRMCMTGWMLHIFLDSDNPYVDAYKQFRCKMMDIMYSEFSDDHANTPTQRAKLWNMTAESLGYHTS